MTRAEVVRRGKSVKISSFKRSALAVGGVAVLLSATIGLTQAQSATPTSTPASTPATTAAASTARQRREAIVNLAATKLGLSGDQLSQALTSARKDLGFNQGGIRIAKLAHQEMTLAATTMGYPDLKSMRADLHGTTLTALATKRGVSPGTVSTALTNDLDSKIQAQVTDGKLTAARAATLRQRADARIAALMTHQFK